MQGGHGKEHDFCLFMPCKFYFAATKRNQVLAKNWEIICKLLINKYDFFGTHCLLLHVFNSGCNVDGKTYTVGETFLDDDGCNTCECRKHEDVVCTRIDCSKFGFKLHVKVLYLSNILLMKLW